MVSLPEHFHPIYNSDYQLLHIQKLKDLPTKIICHPQYLRESAFRIYMETPPKTSKSEFVNTALERGEKFKVVKPKEYVNLNFPEDLTKLKSYIANTLL
jgi:hypothetical protein